MLDRFLRGVGRKNVALYVDGPNMLRKELDTDMERIGTILEEYGRLVSAKVFLNQFTPQKVIEAVANQGWEPVVTMAGKRGKEKSDVDALMGASVMEGVKDDRIDIIAVATRDADFAPVILKAKEQGKETLVITSNPGASISLKNSADHLEVMD